MRTDGEHSGDEMTLAFSTSAVERLADPGAAFEDARTWSRHVGVVDDDREAVARLVEAHDLHQDFDLGDRDRWLAMEGIRETTHTPRHVYVGTTGKDRRVAEQLGWEFVSVSEAAEKAGWTLEGEAPDPGFFERLKRVLDDALSSRSS